jgi:subfamily B ATP-binding cassette protein MsbA
MYKPMQELSKMTDTYSKAAVGYERIQEILQTENEVRDAKGARNAKNLKGKIEFENVSFSYSPDQPIIEDMSFCIRPGQVAAVVGPTGVGKTTIISLVSRFYDPVSGSIKNRRYRYSELQAAIAAAPHQLCFAGQHPVSWPFVAKHRLWKATGYTQGNRPCR